MAADNLTAIGSIAETFDGPHATPTKTDEGPLFLSISSLENGTLDLLKSAHLSELDFAKWTKRVTPQVGDLLFSYETRLGEAALMPEGIKACLGRRMGLLRPNTDRVIPEYLLFAYLSPPFQEVIRAKTNHGATVDRIALKELPSFLIRMPSMEEQEKTVKVLLSLFDKIELNRQINETLEEVAQAIFKSWFVDFDPTRAKVAALESGGGAEDAERAAMRAISGKSDEELSEFEATNQDAFNSLKSTAALFPSALQDSELGEIPMGWEVSTVGSVSQCFDKDRIPLSKREREKRHGTIPYHGATSVMDCVDEPIFDGIYLLLGEDGSVLKVDGSPFIQYIWGKSWVNNHAHVLQGKSGVCTEQLMIFMRLQNITAYVTGAVQLKLNQRNMNSIPFVKATNDINDEFRELISPLYESFRTISDENKVLVETRDALLPKLLSGEIDLSNITSARGEVA